MLKWHFNQPASIARQLILLVFASAVIFHLCMGFAFIVGRPDGLRTQAGETHRLTDLADALEFVPVKSWPVLIDRFETAHPDLVVRVLSSSKQEILGPKIRSPLENYDRIYVKAPGAAIIVEASVKNSNRRAGPPLSDVIFATLLFIASCVTLFLIWAIRTITGPLATFAEAADRFTLADRDEMLAEGGSLELIKASRAFNRMRARIRMLVDDRTRMLAAIGHDLRTPITRLRLRTESVVEINLRQAMIRDLDHMENMVHGALSFLRDGYAKKPMQALDLASLLQSVCDDFNDTGKAVIYKGPDHIASVAHLDDLRRAFTNLVGNAVAHGHEVSVSLEQRADGMIEVNVLDDGPGISEDDKPHVFEPFWQGTGAIHRREEGHGLGLAIVRALVEQHGGSVALSDGETGGLVCQVRLPIGSSGSTGVNSTAAY